MTVINQKSSRWVYIFFLVTIIILKKCNYKSCELKKFSNFHFKSVFWFLVVLKNPPTCNGKKKGSWLKFFRKVDLVVIERTCKWLE